MPSQVIQGFSYDAATRTLFIAFTSGELYAYLDVEPRRPRDFKAAPSKGRYFAEHIRNRYAYRRMDRQARPTRGPGSVGPASPPPAGARR